MTATAERQPAAEVRFLAFVDRDGPVPAHAPWLGPCWLWTGAVLGNGYGQFRASRSRLVLAHRWVAERLIGRRLERTEQVDHLCHDPGVCADGDGCAHRRCCNPMHLTITTPQANNARSGSPSARNAAKVACEHGHDLSRPENVYIHPQRGTRHCKVCARDRARVWAAEQRRTVAAGRKTKTTATVVSLDARRAARAAEAGAPTLTPSTGSEAGRSAAEPSRPPR